MATAPLTTAGQTTSLFKGNWEQRLAQVLDMMREMSHHTDPQEMVRNYSARVRQFMPVNRFLAVSRRDLNPPKYRITRSSLWEKDINPWKDKARLPVLEGGLLGSLFDAGEPQI